MPTNEKKNFPHPKPMNKERKAKHEEEQRNIKWLKIGSIIVGVVVLLLLVGGLLYEKVYTPQKTLAKVQDEKITVTEFQEAVRYQRYNMISNYNYMAQLYRSFGMQMDASTQQSYESQLSEQYAPLIGQQVYTSMVNQKVLDYGAKEAGISVSDEEVNHELQSLWGFYPDGTPTTEPTEAPLASTPTISDVQKTLVNYTLTPTATATESPEDLDTLGSESGPAEITEAVTETPTSEPTATEAPAEMTPTSELSPTPTLSPTPYTEELFQKNVENQFKDNTYFSRAFFQKQLYYQLLQKKVEDSLSAEIQPEEDMVWARHILVATEEEAQKVIERLDAGEDWNALAAELSIDTSNKDKGGDLGWFMKGAMVPDFETAAFAQEVGTYSKTPVKTDYGYHVIQIVGHEVRPLTSSDRSNALTSAYNAWLQAAREKLNVKTSTDYLKFVPTDPTLSSVL